MLCRSGAVAVVSLHHIAYGDDESQPNKLFVQQHHLVGCCITSSRDITLTHSSLG